METDLCKAFTIEGNVVESLEQSRLEQRPLILVQIAQHRKNFVKGSSLSQVGPTIGVFQEQGEKFVMLN
jgi:hypothetical protein